MAQAVKLYYDFLSPPSRVVWLALKLSKTPFEDCPVALRKREQLTDEYKKINRFQKVPALVDGKFNLSESVAMLRYLADKNQLDKKIYPQDLETRARVDEYLEWHQNMRFCCGTFFKKAWVLPMNGLAPKPKPEEIEKMVKDVEDTMGIFERLWMTDDFLIGKDLTVADLLAFSEIDQLRLCQYNISEKKFPKVVKWMKRVDEASKPFNAVAYDFVNKKSKQPVQSKI